MRRDHPMLPYAVTLAAVGLSGQVPKPTTGQGQTTGQGGAGAQPANPSLLQQGPSGKSPD